MAISKIIKVKHLYATIRYVCKNEKTNYGELITAHQCNVPFVARQFDEVTQTRRNHSNRPFTVETWMIFQSFDIGEIEPDKAHQLGIEMANRYLGENHQYIVTTHIDAGHVHNHIVFNATDYVSLKSFDSRDKHIIHDLRKVNDTICAENGLSVITEPKGKGISQREYYARKNQRSYKARLEKLIDKTIQESDTWQDFLEIMDRNIEVRFDSPMAFRMNGQERFTRLSKLGIDYSENSIKYRIENKALEVTNTPDVKTLIDKAQSQYQGKENAGLNRWATRQNIDTLATMAHAMHEEQITKAEYLERQQSTITAVNDLSNKIEALDKKILAHEEYLKYEDIYRSSIPLMQGYKKATDKAAYKKQHYAQFKEYDKAKSVVSQFKNDDGKIPRPDKVLSDLEDLKVERALLYTEYQVAKQRLSSALHQKPEAPSKQHEQKANRDDDER